MASPAQIEANRRNAQKSTGPRTEAGKLRSRSNALKHGLTGAGIALPAEDAHQVEERFRAIHHEMAPQTTVGALLAHQIALMSVRLNRAARQESAALALKVRHAAADFDEARRAEAEHTLGYIGMEPITHRRKLKSTPEGVDVLVQAFRDLRDDLATHRERWDFIREQILEAYLGRRAIEVPVPRSRALSQALQGKTEFLDAADLEAIQAHPTLYSWARGAMLEFPDAELADLLRHRATLDFAAIERDRAEAGERALFDASKDAILARKYEAAASRELYRALREFREVEATGEIITPEPAEVVERSRSVALAAGDAAPTPPIPPAPPEPDRPKSSTALDIDLESGSFGKSPSACPAFAQPTLGSDRIGPQSERDRSDLNDFRRS